MDNKQRPEPTPLNELSELLRQAVEQVRSEPIPTESLNRALDKAEKIGATMAKPRRRILPWVVAGLAAAAVLVAISLSPMLTKHQQSTNVAQKAAAPVDIIRMDLDQAKSVPESATERVPGPVAASVLKEESEGKRAEVADAIKQQEQAINALRENEVNSPRSPDALTSRPASADPIIPRPAVPQANSVLRPGEDRKLSDSNQSNGSANDYRAKNSLQQGQQGQKGQQSQQGQQQGNNKHADAEGRAQSKEAATSPYLGMMRAGGGLADKAKKGDSLDKLEEKSVGNSKSNEDSARQRDKEAAKKDSKLEANKARVWRRITGRPTMARVYVGDGNALDLVSLQVNVTVEGPRARTLVDHVFYNPNDRQLEGTFEYPLPSGASPSYFAMFLGQTRQTVPPLFAKRTDKTAALPIDALAALAPERLVRNVDTTDWGRLQEARIVGKEKALETYEQVVRGRIDPALLEYASGNTFRGRVFPIPAKGYNRVIIAYEELLPVSQGKMLYRFPLPDRKLSTFNLTLQASTADCRDREFLPAGGTKQEAAGHVYYTYTGTGEESEGEMQFACTPTRPEVQALSGRRGDNGPTYTYARIRPDLKQVAADKVPTSHAIFLLDTSLSEHADRFGVSMKLLRKILESNPSIEQFNVIAFNVAATRVEPKGWLPNTPQGRETLFKRLDGIVLEGATDIGAALDCLSEPLQGLSKKSPVDCFLLSDGHATWGETDVAALTARFESRCPFAPRFYCYLTGLGAENTELFESLTRRGGGVFNCRNEADLAAAASAHRSQCLQVENVYFVDGPAVSDVLVAGRRAAIYPGGELVVAGRFQGTGSTTLVVEGTFAGSKYVRKYPVEVKENGELAPRGWAEIAVASLLALNDPKLDPLITAYCQQFNVGSRVASFLVLENEADYKRFNLEEERGKTFSGDLGKFLDQMWTTLAGAVSPREAFVRFLDRVEKLPNLLAGDNSAQVRKLVARLSDKEFELPVAPLAGALVHKNDVPPEYLAARDADRRDATTYLNEARRRVNTGDTDGAVRVLSSIVEEHPARGDALRLVGYRLLDMRQPAQAARLFERVQHQRPFEPHSYRDLARSLEETGNIALAAVQYEIVLGGVWHNRFGESIKLVAQEEYARLMQDAIRRKTVSPVVANYFGERLEQMTNPQPKADLRVTISWNTDATDVDLWVIEPDGTKCFYQNNHTKNGGELSQDQTQGYGPERYQAIKAMKGKYRVLVHYFSNNPNLLAGETHVNVVVTRQAGTPQETTERHTIILKKRGEEAEVCDIDF